MVVRAALLKAQPNPSITPRRSDAYYGQIGNGLGDVIDIAPAFAIRKAIRDSAMACCRRLLCAPRYELWRHQADMGQRASMRAIVGYRVCFGACRAV